MHIKNKLKEMKRKQVFLYFKIGYSPFKIQRIKVINRKNAIMVGKYDCANHFKENAYEKIYFKCELRPKTMKITLCGRKILCVE
jgi:hypothetical protein